MAKKQVSFTIDDIKKQLKDNNVFSGTVEDSEFTKTTEFINTGNYHFNAMLTANLFGGIPNNKSVLISGVSGCVYKDQPIRVYKLRTISEENNRKTIIKTI